jgi:catechol 2,3-dioxygenase-like lactoylglutathione lyase family enzyme
MIQRVSHASLYVLDQESARSFYVDKLGFEVREDEKMGEFRWLTIGPRGQRELEVVLIEVRPSPMMDAATAEALRALIKKGAFGCGVLETDDCQKTYDELRARGVEPMGPPAERPYGIELLIKDDSGNWWSVVQRRR